MIDLTFSRNQEEVLLKEITPSQAIRYSRQINLPKFDLDKQERLLAARVLIIGLGGLGCAAAQYLVASGIGMLTLVDDDEVEMSNLQRQILHTESAVGTSKVESAQHSLQQLSSDSDISCIQQRLDDKALSEQLEKHDMVFDCSDNLDTRNQLNRLCWQAQIPLVSGAAIRMEGQLFCVQPHLNSACYQCLSRLFGEQNLTCSESGVMSPLVGVIGAMQALEGIKLLTGFGTALCNELLIFDAACNQWHRLNVTKFPQCPTCASGLE
ncbi:molybdopterin-synthase adenylyltransferase MoeB [Aliiglaciecola sp. LCG003]|uniref:molybdopterin-synthase adenylyltransferase MoeB n=1 Tax=Aliiglaciecola sp. LCG003 TaxID=3053655 RepID=UPI002573539F|nr:molybdopterin-synthase adenylyltransferase MoeB [Aliiglaciecola sp. LCG003]WJG10728.1 molybdopterin-synthase adenylyltransferase MoeB [Aliiglaciecola sp. LCG003]